MHAPAQSSLKSRGRIQMTENEIRRIVADTVDQTLTRLGVDTENPLEFQRDLQHLREWRTSVAQIKQQGFIAAVGFAGFIAWFAVSNFIAGF